MRIGMLAVACVLSTGWSFALPARAQEAVAAAPAAEGDPLTAAIDAIRVEYAQAQEKFYAKIKGLEDQDEIDRIADEMYPDDAPYVARMQAALAGHLAEPAAVAGLAWIVDHGDAAARKSALDSLRAHHLASPELKPVVSSLAWGSSPEELGFLERVLAESPSRELKGQALFSLAQRHARQGIDGSPEAQQESKQAQALLDQLVAEYGDVVSGKRTLGERAQPYLFELRNLAIGMTAPDIEGTDVAGTTFRLSEYRGKVVVLDFWGFW